MEDTCDDWKGEEGIVKVCSDRVDFHSDGGDSGAPVFTFKSDGTAELRGVVWGWVDFWLGLPYYDALISDLYQIESDLGSLVVRDAAVVVEMSGPSFVTENAECTWTASLTAPGRPPYTVEWRRDGVGVGSGWEHTEYTGSTDFLLEVIVTDGANDTSVDAVSVTVESHGGECDA